MCGIPRMTDCGAFVLTRSDFLATKPIVLDVVNYLKKECIDVSINEEVESYSPIPDVINSEDQNPL